MTRRPAALHRARPANQTDLPQEVAEIPIGMRRAAAWSWRILIVLALAVVVVWALSKIMTIVIPVLVATLLATILTPVVGLLTRHTFLGRTAASLITLLGLIIVIIGMFVLAGRQLFEQFGDIYSATVSGFNQAVQWANDNIPIDNGEIDKALNEAVAKLQENAGTIAQGALTGVSTVGNVVTGLIIAIFTLFFFLAGGDQIWAWIVRLLPIRAREAAHESVRRGWKAMAAYMRTQILVAAVDATGIGIGIWALGLGGYAVPIWLIVFLFSFIPIVGAVVSGAVAVLIVFFLLGWVKALIMIGIVLAVQQLESNVLQPFLMGKAVALHPLAVFLGVAVGTMVAGIPGALFAIPLIAFANAMVLYLAGRDPAPELGHDDKAAEAYAPARRTMRRA
ncbi:AI-2E family transporter [Brachybacterium huguangmaarense]